LYATDVLEQEHRVIERILPVLEEAAHRVERGRKLDDDVFPIIIDFLRVFSDRCHHAKEEARLFPVLKQTGVIAEPGLIGELSEEHRQLRAMVKKLAEYSENLGEEESPEEIAAITRVFVKMLAVHIKKEDDVLFPEADRGLSQEAAAQLQEDFRKIESRPPCQGALTRYEDLVAELEERLGFS